MAPEPFDRSVDVLIIDDDVNIQEVVNDVLEDADIRAETCTLGWKAHLCIRQARPRAVILDVMMPGVDGIRLFYLLRADPSTRDIPVIFLTAAPQKVLQELPNYAEMGAVLVAKPFDIDALLESVVMALAV